MRAVLGAALCAAVFSANAYAGDLYSPAGGYKDAYVPGPSWTGFYVGLNGGYGWDGWKGDFTYEGKTDPGFTPQKTVTGNGGFGGGQIGFNEQLNSVVLGLEADIEGSGIAGKGDFNYNSTFGTPAKPIFTKDAGFSLDYFGTLRARAGWSLGNFLPYVTGGLAWGHAQSHITVFNNYLNSLPAGAGGITGPSATGEASADHIGYAVGAGAEYALSPHWSVKAEYLYMDLGTEGYRWTGSCNPSVGCAQNVFNTDGFRSNLTVSTVKAGINYKIGSGYEPLK